MSSDILELLADQALDLKDQQNDPNDEEKEKEAINKLAILMISVGASILTASLVFTLLKLKARPAKDDYFGDYFNKKYQEQKDKEAKDTASMLEILTSISKLTAKSGKILSQVQKTHLLLLERVFIEKQIAFLETKEEIQTRHGLNDQEIENLVEKS